ncbi:60S ribosomal protein L3 [Hysterangium stoloniferum]|nr:60S ribosomal protein L3 [Hysterangium stoloniferum]
MIHGQRRLLSTISKKIAVPKASLFPPKEAKSREQRNAFKPEEWIARQPPPPSALKAFAHRIGLSDSLADPAVIQQVCIHPSFVAVHQAQRPNEPIPPSNGSLASVGNALLGLFATEYVHMTYPHLPTRVMKAVVSAYVGPLSCASVAQEMGAAQLLRWDRTPNGATRASLLHTEALSSIPRALTALIYQQRSLSSARKWTHDFFLSRTVDIRALIRFRDPKVALVDTVAKFGRERPISRLLRETGRLSNSPVFVVGIYSGTDKLGEGFGSSLKMAEYRAAEDSLHRLYLVQHPPEHSALPTTTFPSTPIFRFKGASETYTPGPMGQSEVNYGLSGRGGSTAGAGRQRLPGGVVYADEPESDRHRSK